MADGAIDPTDGLFVRLPGGSDSEQPEEAGAEEADVAAAGRDAPEEVRIPLFLLHLTTEPAGFH